MAKRRTKLPSGAPDVIPSRKNNRKTLSQFLIDYDRGRKATADEEATYARLVQFFSPDLAVRRKAAREAIELLIQKGPLSKLSNADHYALALS